MSDPTPSRASRRLLALAVLLVAGASAWAAPDRSAREKALRDRVTAYWQARTRTDLHAAYPFYEPAFRAQYSEDAFARNFRRLNRFAPEFLGIEGVAIDEEGPRAVVRIKLRSTPGVLDGQELLSVTEETWLLQDGTWWKQGEALLPNV